MKFTSSVLKTRIGLVAVPLLALGLGFVGPARAAGWGGEQAGPYGWNQGNSAQRLYTENGDARRQGIQTPFGPYDWRWRSADQQPYAASGQGRWQNGQRPFPIYGWNQPRPAQQLHGTGSYGPPQNSARPFRPYDWNQANSSRPAFDQAGQRNDFRPFPSYAWNQQLPNQRLYGTGGNGLPQNNDRPFPSYGWNQHNPGPGQPFLGMNGGNAQLGNERPFRSYGWNQQSLIQQLYGPSFYARQRNTDWRQFGRNNDAWQRAGQTQPVDPGWTDRNAGPLQYGQAKWGQRRSEQDQRGFYASDWQAAHQPYRAIGFGPRPASWQVFGSINRNGQEDFQ